jgi:hypothetical protein
VIAAGREDPLRVELGLRPPAPGDHPARAMTEHVDVRVRYCPEHARGHFRCGHPQLGVDAGDDDVQLAQQILALIQAAVFQDVDLNAGQDPKRRELVVDLVDQLELIDQPFRGQPAGDGEPR